MGADISADLMPGVDSNNPSGFWESNEIYAIHNKLFKSIGIDWFNLSSEIIKDGDKAALSEFKNAAEVILKEEFSRTRILVIKDPRICILAQYWIESIQSVNATPVAVLPIRNPMEVATSIRDRDNIDINYGLFLWLRHFLDSERHTRNLARSFCSFNDLIADWKGTVNKISRDISVKWPSAPSEVAEQVEAYLSPESKHYNISDQEFMLDKSIPALVKRAYAVALDLVKNGESDHSQQEIDDIAALVDSIEVFTGKRLVARDQMAAYLESEVVENREEQARLNKLLTEQSTRAQLEIGEKLEAIQLLSDENSSLQQVMSEKEELLQEALNNSNVLQQIISEKEELLQEMLKESNTLHQENDEKEKIISEKEELLQEMLKSSSALHQENDRKEKIISELRNELNLLQQNTASLQDDIASLLGSRSWRVTAPVRWLLHLAQNLFLTKDRSNMGIAMREDENNRVIVAGDFGKVNEKNEATSFDADYFDTLQNLHGFVTKNNLVTASDQKTNSKTFIPRSKELSILGKFTSKAGKILGLGGAFRLEPMFGLQKIEKEDCWKSTCGDPQFDVYDACKVVSKGVVSIPDKNTK